MKKLKELYILISWPEIQDFMEHERWDEYVFCREISTYIVPLDLFIEIYNLKV